MQIADRAAGAIKLSPLDAVPEPTGLRRLKVEVGRRWGAVPLVDMLKEAVLRTGCLGEVTSLTGRSALSPDVLAERLVEAARQIAVQIANATFAVRAQTVWGAGSTAVASDSTHVAAFDQNILTQWHSRYGGRGILIYWHVERDSMAIHSQLISCTASEVAAMVEGAIRHGTTMDVAGNYVDSHGQSEIGFGVTRLLGFDLLPRIK
ncbi:MAG: Tn3 family transposase [Pseudonocardia sp.]